MSDRDDADLRPQLAAGSRLVRFEYCISALVFTIRRQTAVQPTSSRRQRCLRGLRYSLAALLLGPWGIPWGPICTAWAVWVNLTGGVEETDSFTTQ
jgi:hypothetical protein